jgi:hypothetical protein
MLTCLLITECKDKQKWYASLVGCLVPLLRIEKTEYKSLEQGGYVNFVSLGDAEVIELNMNKSDFYDIYVQDR